MSDAPSGSYLCFPGFLGGEKDFDFLSAKKIVLPLFTRTCSGNNFFARPFMEFSESVKQYLSNSSERVEAAVGYSLGGRLLLHTACQFPELFKKIVIIASHTGLGSDEEKSARRESDERWSDKFARSPWESVIEEWNSLSLLKSQRTPQRLESEFDKSMLQFALTEWSLGNQQDLVKPIVSLPVNLLWIVGLNDEKFLNVATKLVGRAKNIQLEVVPDAGHRVMWEKPLIVDTLIRNYVEKN